MFQQLTQLSADSILGLMAKYRADSSPLKVDLGVGVYRDLSGNTPVLACVAQAERAVLAAQTTKSYVAAAGREEFNSAVEEMVLGSAHAARDLQHVTLSRIGADAVLPDRDQCPDPFPV